MKSNNGSFEKLSHTPNGLITTLDISSTAYNLFIMGSQENIRYFSKNKSRKITEIKSRE
tara:strand:- start:1917 stop:2093 length:177 start_codon:yes stop_codon:yes gene_type:complete